jgi:hypothetical protein
VAEPVTTTTQLPQRTTLAEAVGLLLAELGDWLGEADARHRGVPWQGIHDEGTFLTAWAPYYALTGDERVRTLARAIGDSALSWWAANGRHGYHPRQEAHHGPEHFTIFLDWLLQLDPDDGRLREAIGDAAHHIVRELPGVPPWYEPREKRFLSAYIGTAEVGDDGLNMIDHLRFVYLALQAHAISGDEAYLAFARSYAGEWATAVAEGELAPLYLASDTAHQQYQSALGAFLGAAPKTFGPLERIECHVASGAPQLFLRLWRLTGEELFLRAAKRLILPLVPELADPYANPAGYLLSVYRRATGDRSRDAAILAAIGPPPTFPVGARLTIEPEATWGESRGIGKREDMPRWRLLGPNEEVLPLPPSPAALMLAAEISGDGRYAVAAAELALAKLRLARLVYRDGRHHGCTARSVAAICRGHGRCWGAGDVASVLFHPLVSGSDEALWIRTN